MPSPARDAEVLLIRVLSSSFPLLRKDRERHRNLLNSPAVRLAIRFGPCVQDRVIRDIDSLGQVGGHEEEGVLQLLRVERLRNGDLTQLHGRSTVRPDLGRVTGHVAGFRKLNEQTKPDRFFFNRGSQIVRERMGWTFRGVFVAHIGLTRLGEDAVAPEFARSLCIGEFQRVHAEEGLRAVAHRHRFRRADKLGRGRMTRQELLDRRGLGSIGAAGSGRVEEFKKILAGRHGESVDRQSHDVVLTPVRQPELDCHASDAADGRVEVRRVRHPAGVREPDGQGGRSAFQKCSRAQCVGARGRRKAALEKSAGGVIGPCLWMRAVEGIHLIDQAGSQGLVLGAGTADSQDRDCSGNAGRETLHETHENLHLPPISGHSAAARAIAPKASKNQLRSAMTSMRTWGQSPASDQQFGPSLPWPSPDMPRSPRAGSEPIVGMSLRPLYCIVAD